MKFIRCCVGSVLCAVFVPHGLAVAAETKLDEVTVTATREAQAMKESSHTVGVIGADDLQDVKPSHPAEIMERVPGVHVNVTGGEGHMTAIRQPLTTKPMYLYLEDGIPTRSTGFFNHNALYEINLPQSDRIEVLKGPGSALYGSDAIGAVVNAQTRPAPLKPEAEVVMEGGEFGFQRLLVSGGNTIGDNGYRADLNLTQTAGWRKATAYDRVSAGARWDSTLQNGASLKMVLTGSEIDQQTAGSSRLSADDYYNNPTENYTPISLRKVGANRLSAAYEKESGDSLLNITPYLRDNSMTLLPNWSLSYDPTIYETGNTSQGLQVRYRRDFKPMRTRLITGIDIDHSPGSRFEQSINATQTGNIYDSYNTGVTIYDYDVTYVGVSPYLHLEFSPSTATRISLGLRYDDMRYEFDNHINTATTTATPTHLGRTLTYNQISDGEATFSRLSPKLGLTHSFNETLNGFVSWRQAFRAPSEGQIFRPGSTVDTLSLKPVVADSIETGLRGKSGKLTYNLSLYSMRLKDDILSYDNPDTGNRETVNAGETRHTGIEVGLETKPADQFTLHVAVSQATHTYEQWQPSAAVNYSGNEIEMAPGLMSNVQLIYTPLFLNGGNLALEWIKLGEYWMDPANSYMYQGHDLLNLRASYRLGKTIKLYGRLMNLADKRYATAAQYSAATAFRPEKFEYAPGMPRTAYLGLQVDF
ncbi:MAG: TonB-dependent receptor [Gammaproteobacteria bacterium]|nr:TonB-dependent receptor [Gammaproteobacteria bacterium]MDH5652554.1 TonB-dependent receptor [Gammaproteobacteria bacterium]